MVTGELLFGAQLAPPPRGGATLPTRAELPAMLYRLLASRRKHPAMIPYPITTRLHAVVSPHMPTSMTPVRRVCNSRARFRLGTPSVET